MSGIIGRFKIKRVEPAKPQGRVLITYDQEEDILWIGLRYNCVGDGCIHARAELLIEEDQGLILAVMPGGRSAIASIALRHASRHSLWAGLFRGFELALSQRKRMRFTVDPSEWRLE